MEDELNTQFSCWEEQKKIKNKGNQCKTELMNNQWFIIFAYPTNFNGETPLFFF